MLWRFSANNTHLYPGAFLRCLDTVSEMNLKEGDELLVEFSDGVIVNGQLLHANAEAVTLQLPTYRAGHGTDVAERTWRIVPGDEPGFMHVKKRLR